MRMNIKKIISCVINYAYRRQGDFYDSGGCEMLFPLRNEYQKYLMCSRQTSAKYNQRNNKKYQANKGDR